MKNLVVLIAFGLAGGVHAGKTVRFPSAAVKPDTGMEFQVGSADRIILGEARPGSLKLLVGDTVQVDSVGFLLSPMLKRKTLGQRKNDSILIALMEKQDQTRQQIQSQYELLDSKWQKIHAVDSVSFAKLLGNYQKTDDLLVESIELNKQLIRQSYMVSGMAGALGGGLLGASFKEASPGTTLLFAVGGAAVGTALNWVLQRSH